MIGLTDDGEIMGSNKKKRNRRNNRARNGRSRPAAPEQKRPWYKSQLAWTGAVLTAVVIAGLGAGLSALTTDATSRVINHIAEPATPFTATVSVDYASPPGLALPTLLADGPDLAMLIKGEEFDTSALLARQHGAAVESLHVDVALTGLSREAGDDTQAAYRARRPLWPSAGWHIP